MLDQSDLSESSDKLAPVLSLETLTQMRIKDDYIYGNCKS